ncbi:translation initiation factor IF-1 [Candidatus Giovannonibacteria bacterium RIFCSPHIGHO2_02_43_13]|uniref:Translation initiation factor IF-1 n=1 Tax=Candidatus Giovannonibacteria bacterium RIFCSPHIGHO2_02_43_13 TaxID=1798330 RepID=A0A1F5WPU0_9BACT|nr:MAG: Translation initiation factor IF-1 [Parcubacteria group bacterium GW2011_GWA2_44_13]OGF72363.1 MAG: translation initiation factor IF-1 [Candidatus Giovannonibacteria bacterium RIFCSPHIGHO2_12_FULL_44_42]OGF77640.1 MAG: translation initiation factor IF-1 [Candidatus Giovannonibacteria bacterium RIFCSPHIGHO2_02_43_13]OGF88607.1 MAG: translation initiation factor IF-1 [Candidatus Giovannonibacteria bacterium RIFCSPLOWO2_02_FULL_43_54]OGF97006.1 MAG: translation initiation factor IF-1 [Cand
MASNKGTVIKEGRVVEALPSATFRIQIDGEEREIVGHLSGKMRLHYIKVLVGDKVTVEFSPYDETKGRIIKRL